MAFDAAFVGMARQLANRRYDIQQQDADSRQMAAEASAALDRTRASVLPGFTDAQIGQLTADANRLQAGATTTYDQNPFMQALLSGQAANQRGQGYASVGQGLNFFRNATDAPDPLLGAVGARMGYPGGIQSVSLTPSTGPAPVGLPTPLAQPQTMPGGGVGFGGRVTSMGGGIPTARLPTVTATGVTGLPPASSWDMLGPAGRERLERDTANRRPGVSQPGYAKGTARVPGKGDGTKDTVSAKLAPGEAVVNKEAADMIGRGLIAVMNNMGAQKMGLV